MKKLLLIVACVLPFITAPQSEAAESCIVHLYDYLGMDWMPFANAELVSVKPGLIRFKYGSKEIEHSGRFSIQQSAAEKKWWQFGSNGEEVGLVIFYGYMKMEMIPFREPKVFDKRGSFVVFEVGGMRYTHCGRYSIQR